jgi:predicted ester cyclase
VAHDASGGGLVGRFADRGAARTDEEQRNIETVIALRRASFQQRKAFHGPGFVVHRRGMAHLAAGGDFPGTGYDSAAIADRVDEIVDIIAKDDRVWCVWMIRGTHTGPLFGIAPTGRPIEVLEMGAWRFHNGKVAEAWFFADEYALAGQLGVAPVAQ